MDGAAHGEGYQPPPEFQEDGKQSLVELSLTDSTELWLIQWPINSPPDFDGQQLSLKLHHDGQLGSFESSSGKLYDVISFASQEPNSTVFLSSASDSKVVGKISRRVSFVHYPEPDELEKGPSNNLKNIYLRSSGTSLTHSSHNYATPSKGTILSNSRPSSSQGTILRNSRPSKAQGTILSNSRPSSSQGTDLRNTRSSSGSAVSKPSSRQRSLSEVGEQPKSSRKRRVHESVGSMDRSTLDSERGNHAGTSSGSVGHSHQKRGKKMKIEK